MRVGAQVKIDSANVTVTSPASPTTRRIMEEKRKLKMRGARRDLDLLVDITVGGRAGGGSTKCQYPGITLPANNSVDTKENGLI